MNIRHLVHRLRRLELGSSPGDWGAPIGDVATLYMPSNGRENENPEDVIDESRRPSIGGVVLYEPALNKPAVPEESGDEPAAPLPEEHGGTER